MQCQKLPIGIQTFRKVREDGCYYVDKTPCILDLIAGGTHYFLSRPRRFGKSLLLDTVKELFEGSRELFAGLHAESRWNWDAAHPVLRISFGSGLFTEPEGVRRSFEAQMDRLAERLDLTVGRYAGPERLASYIEALHRLTEERVVLLIDEYDKPILDALDDPDLARANRDYLRGLYSVVKDSDAHIRFSFITGVSKFSKVNLFSGLNNLTDITLDPEYSTICGYTEADLDAVFAPELPDLDRERIREWYNGYSWLGDEKVYNPFDILLLFRTRRFRAHWFETGTPDFLLQTLLRRRVGPLELERMVATEALVSRFDVGDIATEALLFQTGYLTIVGERERHGQVRYELGYPNREVRDSLNGSLLRHLTRDARQEANADRLCDLLEDGDVDGLMELFHAFYAGIPYEWYTNNAIASYEGPIAGSALRCRCAPPPPPAQPRRPPTEQAPPAATPRPALAPWEGYYAAVFYAYFASLGLDVSVEDSTNRGRLDMALRFEGDVYLFEFKVVEQAGEGAALAQLVERGYAEKYLGGGTRVHLVGVEFSSETRNIAAFDAESL